MRTELDPTQTTETEPSPTSDQPPAEVDPPPIEPEPEEDAPPPLPPADPGELNVQVEPATWYEVTSVCSTSTCVNLNTTTTEPMAYSNAGILRMICGPCGKDRPILDYRKLDPQPEVS
jgi:hypothetical protein